MKKTSFFAMFLMAACCAKASPRNVAASFPVSPNDNGEFSEEIILENKFDNGNTEGWNIEGKCKTSNGVVEFYENAFNFHQTRTGLSNGPPRPERKPVMGNLWKRLRTSGQKPI